MVWAVLGWVRRNLFNQAPDHQYNPTTTMQTGQTVTGNIGATDPEDDALTYTVTARHPHHTAALTIDQATGKFTYTPDDINYDAAQTDSFTVSVTDGNSTCWVCSARTTIRRPSTSRCSTPPSSA